MKKHQKSNFKMSAPRLTGFGTVALALCCFCVSAGAAAAFQVPRLSGPVVDQGGFLSPAAARRISSYLTEIKRQSGGTEIAVLTVPELGGLTIEQASIRVVDEWKLGDAKADNGVLLMFSKAERRARIEVGQGLEGMLTDAHAKRIIDETIVPLFRAGNMEEGILLGIYQVAKRTNPELDLEQIFGAVSKGWDERPQSGGGFGALIPLIFILLLIFTGRGRRGLAGGFLTGMLLGGLTGSHHRRGGLSGGGFGGFSGGGGFGGGGGFSGGGASGGW